MAVNDVQANIQRLASNWQKVQQQQSDGGVLINQHGKLIGEEFGTFKGKFVKALVRAGIAREGNFGGRIAVALVGADAFGALNMSSAERKENSVKNVLALLNNLDTTSLDRDLTTAARNNINQQFPISGKVARGKVAREITENQIGRLGLVLESLHKEVIPQRLAQRTSAAAAIRAGQPTQVMHQTSASAMSLALGGLESDVDQLVADKNLNERLSKLVDMDGGGKGSRVAAEADQLLQEYRAVRFQVCGDLESQIGDLKQKIGNPGQQSNSANDLQVKLAQVQGELTNSESELKNQYINTLRQTLLNKVDGVRAGITPQAMLKTSESALSLALQGFEQEVDRLPPAQMTAQLQDMGNDLFQHITHGQGKLLGQADLLLKEYCTSRNQLCGDLETQIKDVEQQIKGAQPSPQPLASTAELQARLGELKGTMANTESELRGKYVSQLTHALQTVKQQDGMHVLDDGPHWQRVSERQKGGRTPSVRMEHVDGTTSRGFSPNVTIGSSAHVEVADARSLAPPGWAEDFQVSLAQAQLDQHTIPNGGQEELRNLAKTLTELLDNPGISAEDKHTAYALRQSEAFWHDFACLGEVLGGGPTMERHNGWRELCKDPERLQFYEHADTASARAVLDNKERELEQIKMNPESHPDYTDYVEVFGSEENARAEIVNEADGTKDSGVVGLRAVNMLRNRIGVLERALSSYQAQKAAASASAAPAPEDSATTTPAGDAPRESQEELVREVERRVEREAQNIIVP